jgi:hypothetical protein
MEKLELNNKKYDAISVEGPLDAKNGKQFFKCMFEENATDNGGYSSQSRGYIKNFFDDTHSLIFKRCEQHQDNPQIPVRIIAAKASVEVKPFYMFDKNGKEMLSNVDGKQLIGRHLSIFVLPDENADGEVRRRSRTLKFVDVVDEEDDVEAEKAEALVTDKTKLKK